MILLGTGNWRGQPDELPLTRRLTPVAQEECRAFEVTLSLHSVDRRSLQSLNGEVF